MTRQDDPDTDCRSLEAKISDHTTGKLAKDLRQRYANVAEEDLPAEMVELVMKISAAASNSKSTS